MPLADRQDIFSRIEELRGGRELIAYFNFDRQSSPELPGLTSQFHADSKEALYRVLKESNARERGIDLCLYTRGGDTNSVWPIVTLLREFDREFEVLVPFRAHSAGTLLAMAGRRIVMGSLSELSPIDPTTGNQFNPRNPSNQEQRLGISVEDVSGFFHFVRHYLIGKDEAAELAPDERDALMEPVRELVSEVHPLALGNVWRVHQQIKKLARQLLQCHEREGQQDLEKIVDDFTSRFYSHLHMINRHEARDALGGDHVQFASAPLENELDALLRRYEDDFGLRNRFMIASYLGDELQKDVRFIGAAIESTNRGYLFETSGQVTQRSEIPSSVQVQVPPGQPVPLIPGLPRKQNFQIRRQEWVHNREPQGVTL